MAEPKIFEGKTTTEAITKGLNYFNVSKDEVEIKIIEEEKRSFFSILEPRVVKVEMKLKEVKSEKKHNTERPKVTEEDLQKAEKISLDFLKELFEKAGVKNLTYKTKISGDYLEISLNGDEISRFIGYRGETLNELQVLVNAVLRNKTRTNVRVVLDICNYKDARKKTLEELAEKISKTVIRTGKPITLDPMKPYERKIIHTKLQENEKIDTHSIGEEPHRRIVVSLKK